MWYIEMGGMYKIKNSKYFGRKIYTSYDKMHEIRNKFGNEDVYATIFSYNKEDQNESDLFGAFYLDLDLDIQNESDYMILKRDIINIVNYIEESYGIKHTSIKFYFSGKKGFHLIIPCSVLGITPDKNLNVYYKEMAKEINNATVTGLIDTKIYDKKRLFRLPNSINGKTGLYKVPIKYKQILSFSFEEMKEYAKKPKDNIEVDMKECSKAMIKFNEIKDTVKNPKAKAKRNIKTISLEEAKLPPCIVNILEEGAPEGSRNNTTVILASCLLQQGVSHNDTLDLVMEWNDRKNNPSLSDNEIKTTVDSANSQVLGGRCYGCTAIKDIGLCVGRECKMYK